VWKQFPPAYSGGCIVGDDRPRQLVPVKTVKYVPKPGPASHVVNVCVPLVGTVHL
jgi:hypothetical protein